MGIFYDCSGDPVEIPTFQEHPKNEEYIRVETEDDMTLLVKAMGFEDREDFDAECQIPSSDLVGKWFCLMGKANGRLDKQPVFIMESVN